MTPDIATEYCALVHRKTTGCGDDWGSRSFGAKNNDPLEVLATGTPVLSRCFVWPPLLDTIVCSAFGLQALQDIEPRQRPTGLLDQPTIAQIA